MTNKKLGTPKMDILKLNTVLNKYIQRSVT